MAPTSTGAGVRGPGRARARRRARDRPPAGGRERYRALRSGECPLSPTPWRSPPTSRPRAGTSGARWSRRCSPSPAARPTPDAVEDALAYTTYDGILIAPLYTADDAHDVDADGRPGRPPFVRGATARRRDETGWDVRTRHADADAGAGRTRPCWHDLERGATSLWLVVGRRRPRRRRPRRGSRRRLPRPRADRAGRRRAVRRSSCRLCSAWPSAAASTRASCAARSAPTRSARRARTGARRPTSTLLLTLAEQSTAAPKLRLATVDATVYHDAGASRRAGTRHRPPPSASPTCARSPTPALAVDDALAALEFRWAVTAEQFPSIAKLRAARRVWDRVAELCGASDERRGQHQHAVTSAAMMTRRDPWVNMLRTTIACFAAAVGGADAITVLPFDAAIGVPDDFARRIARNTHAGAARRVEPGPGRRRRPAARGSSSRSPTSSPRRRGTCSPASSGPAARWPRSTTARSSDCSPRTRARARRRHRPPPRADHRRQRVRVRRREAGRARPAAGRRADGACCRASATPQTSRRCATAPMPRPSGRRSSSPRSGRSAAHSARAGFAANLFQPPAASTCVTGAGRRVRAARARRSPACARPTRSTPTRPSAAAQALRARRRDARSGWPGKAEVDGVDGTCSPAATRWPSCARTLDTLGVAG